MENNWKLIKNEKQRMRILKAVENERLKSRKKEKLVIAKKEKKSWIKKENSPAVSE